MRTEGKYRGETYKKPQNFKREENKLKQETLTLHSQNTFSFDLYNHHLTGDSRKGQVQLYTLYIYTNTRFLKQSSWEITLIPTGRLRLLLSCAAKPAEMQQHRPSVTALPLAPEDALSPPQYLSVHPWGNPCIPSLSGAGVVPDTAYCVLSIFQPLPPPSCVCCVQWDSSVLLVNRGLDFRSNTES